MEVHFYNGLAQLNDAIQACAHIVRAEEKKQNIPINHKHIRQDPFICSNQLNAVNLQNVNY